MHFEVVIRQMMRKVRVQIQIILRRPIGYTKDFTLQNDKLYGMKVVEDARIQLSTKKEGQIVSPRITDAKIHY
jgi:DNA-directed RNA polymerase subunit beta'